MRVEYNYLPQMYDPEGKLWQDIVHDIGQLIAEGDFTLGKWVYKFEAAICEKFGVEYCIGVGSGTDALILAMRAFNLGSQDTILVPANTFIATVNAIVAVGAHPMFIDVGSDYLMDSDKAVHRRVDAAMVVHLTGLAKEQNLWPIVINDAAQAIGAEDNGRSVATFQDVSCFSLHPLKNVHGIGDGGFITTNSGSLAEELELIRNHGLMNRDTCVVPGSLNSRLDSIQAIAAWHGLKIMDEVNDKRRANAARYDGGLKDCHYIGIPPREKGLLPVYHTYVIQATARDELQKYLRDKKGIETKVHYPVPVHLQPAYGYLGYKRGDLPETERQADMILSLPVHEYLTDYDLAYVIQSIYDFYMNDFYKVIDGTD